MAGGASGSTPMVDIQHVNHVFPGGVHAVCDASMHIGQGEFVAIVGPSGCGKTTLLNLVAGLVPLHDGTISVNGQPPEAGRHDVAYMLARDCLFPWRTALSNVMVGGEFRGAQATETRSRALSLLEQVGLKDFTDHYPKALSHGMRQRVALARTFSLKSPVLLMDEPFGALDAQTKLQLQSVLLELYSAERRTVLFITHDLSEAVTLADRVIVMSPRPGRIIADIRVPLPRPRSAKALQKDPEFHRLYAELWGWLEQTLEVTA